MVDIRHRNRPSMPLRQTHLHQSDDPFE